jgi:ActR/RegA family two-component response regulator
MVRWNHVAIYYVFLKTNISDAIRRKDIHVLLAA